MTARIKPAPAMVTVLSPGHPQHIADLFESHEIEWEHAACRCMQATRRRSRDRPAVDSHGRRGLVRARARGGGRVEAVLA